MTVLDQMTRLGMQAKVASRQLSQMSAAEKNAALLAMAESLEGPTAPLLEANARDLEVGRQLGLSAAMLDRLALTEARVAAMARGLRDVAALPDPVGRILDQRTRPNGLRIEKVSSPIGVVVIIYESRPNVTSDAASLCLKSGNACILRGGKEALHSNQWIAQAMIEAARRRVPSFPEHAIQVVPIADREAIPALLSLTQYVDLCMPRGGEGLIRAVTECSKVPVIKHYKGVCHVFVDRDAEMEMAERIVINAKCQRPSTCNAMETLLVDRSVAARFLRLILPGLVQYKVEVRGDSESLAALAAGPGLKTVIATEADYATEHNDFVLNIRVVDGVLEAAAHIAQFGSAHSDCIVTANASTARRFLSEVDSAAVYWNASTRFTDGGEFGMGAEIGISTDKVGARGPMGLEELTTYRWLVYGNGQVRA
ncbi:MAG: glutamate-5-semialdehyde dehydrogenase [Verrucomicrobia bacterium]|nr:glutamate-5-semialdehyde dehydrogenase [Verrucomicrobiota bacterium]MBI3866979.1 glutamate-5-semialdehyde dehydrogenase [Verrucomicrobiota bacterium]